MKIEEILIKYFGWTQSEIENKFEILNRINYINDEKDVLSKAEFYKKEFNLSDDDFNKMLKSLPALLGYSEESVCRKKEFYKKEFSLSGNDFNKILKILPTLLGLLEESVCKKKEFYKKEFSLSDNDFNKMLKILPTLLGYSEESVKSKEEFYKKEFDLNDNDFSKMLKVLPALLSFSEESVCRKKEFYKKEFSLSGNDFNKILKMLPQLLGLLEESVCKKKEFYKKEFNLGDSDFSKMLKTQPALLSLSDESIKKKHGQIKDLNIPKEALVDGPKILAVPENCLKIRYLILRTVATREEITAKPGAFMTSQNKTYARLVYLTDKTKRRLRLDDLRMDEKTFAKRHGVESEELMEKYKIDLNVIQGLKNAVKNEEMADFNSEEKNYFEKEYGGK